MAASEARIQTQPAYQALPTVQEQGEGKQQREDDEVSDFGDEQVWLTSLLLLLSSSNSLCRSADHTNPMYLDILCSIQKVTSL